MNILAAVVGGIWGTVAFTAIAMIALRMRVTQFDLGCLIGEFFLPPGRRAHALGLAIHLLNGVVFGLVYMALWTFFIGYSPVPPELRFFAAAMGAMFGAYHFGLQTPLLGLAGTRHPRVRRGELTDPGPWAINYGPFAHATWLLSHMAFGAVFVLVAGSGFGYGALVAGLVAFIALALVDVFFFRSEFEERPPAVTFLREEEKVPTERP